MSKFTIIASDGDTNAPTSVEEDPIRKAYLDGQETGQQRLTEYILTHQIMKDENYLEELSKWRDTIGATVICRERATGRNKLRDQIKELLKGF